MVSGWGPAFCHSECSEQSVGKGYGSLAPFGMTNQKHSPVFRISGPVLANLVCSQPSLDTGELYGGSTVVVVWTAEGQGRRDSNPQSTALETVALPLCYAPNTGIIGSVRPECQQPTRLHGDTFVP